MKTPQYCYHYPRPALTVDMVVWGYSDNQFYVLFIQRKDEPFKNKWALPGGFVEENETGEEAAHRELKEETALENLSLEQLYTVSELNRDPRGRTVSIIFYTLCLKADVKPTAGDDAKHLEWFPVNNLPPLAFDHYDVMQKAKNHLLSLAKNLKIGPEMFKEPFSKNEIIDCYNAIANGIGSRAFDILENSGAVENDKMKNNRFIFNYNKLQKLWDEGLLYFST